VSKRLQAVIFDLDGTLVDSEKNWQVSDGEFLKSLGMDYTQEMWEKTIGMGGRAMAAMIKDQLKLDKSLDELCLYKDDLYIQQAKGRTKAFPEMIKLLEAFKLQKLPLAVASGSSLRVIHASLAETPILGKFSLITSADQVARGKPEPDLFIYTARKLGVNPENCLVFEDSLYGVQAGLAAGMTVVAVPEIWKAEKALEFEKAHLLFAEGMRNFTAEAVLDWIDSHYCQCEDCTFYDLGHCKD